MGVFFTRRAAKRIAEQTEKAERKPLELPLPKLKRGATATGAISVGYTKTDLTARSSTTPGYGTVYLKTLNVSGALEGTEEVTVYNPFSLKVEKDSYVIIGYVTEWWVIAADCDEELA